MPLFDGENIHCPNSEWKTMTTIFDAVISFCKSTLQAESCAAFESMLTRWFQISSSNTVSSEVWWVRDITHPINSRHEPCQRTCTLWKVCCSVGTIPVWFVLKHIFFHSMLYLLTHLLLLLYELAVPCTERKKTSFMWLQNNLQMQFSGSCQMETWIA